MNNKALPIIHNLIIYNPAFIDFYLLLGLEKFKEKFHTTKPQLRALELTYARLTIENALTEAFITQHDETHRIVKERMLVILMVAFWESVIWHSKGFWFAILTLLPNTGLFHIINTIIDKHTEYQNALYAACVSSVEKALAKVKIVERKKDKASFDQALYDEIEELQVLIKIRKEEIKNIKQKTQAQSWIRVLISRIMFGIAYVVAALQVFGVKKPSSKKVQMWKKEIENIAPISPRFKFVRTEHKKSQTQLEEYEPS